MADQKTPKVEPLSVRRNMMFNTVGSLAYQGCLWLTTVLVVTLSHGYSDSGVLAFAMTVGNMFNPIATYSMRTYQVSDVEGEYTQSNYVSFRLVTILIGLAFAVPYTAIVGSSDALVTTSLLYLLFKTDEAFADVLYGVDQRGGRMDYIGISQFVRGVLLLVSFSVLLATTGSIEVAVVGMAGSCFVVTLAYDIPHARRIDGIKPAISGKDVKQMLWRCLPIVVSTLLLSMVVSVARQCFLGLYGEEALGLYAAVATPAVLIQAAARYLYSPALVPLSERWESRGKSAFVSYFRKTVAYMGAGVLVMVVFLGLAGDWLLTTFYGSSIESYVYLFPYVLVCTGLIAFMWYFSDVLVIMRSMRGLLVSNGAAFALCLVIMVPFETAFYMNGINYSIIASMILGVCLALFFIVRSLSQPAVDKTRDSQDAKDETH
jgi:O-antigen/teichoic acid export membrane protein